MLPLFLILAGIGLEYTGLDIWWISHFYDQASRTWPYRDHWLFNTIIHEGGRYFNMGTAILWLACFSLTFCLKPFKPHRKILAYFLAASTGGPLVVGAGKNLTHIYTPWDLALFSGTQPYIRLFDPVPVGAPTGLGFPSGHASGGYAWLSLYFVLSQCNSQYKKSGLFFGLGLGLLFGVGQQVRGAHFPSHDLFSMVICWYAALIIHIIFYPEKKRGFTHVQ